MYYWNKSAVSSAHLSRQLSWVAFKGFPLASVCLQRPGLSPTVHVRTWAVWRGKQRSGETLPKLYDAFTCRRILYLPEIKSAPESTLFIEMSWKWDVCKTAFSALMSRISNLIHEYFNYDVLFNTGEVSQHHYSFVLGTYDRKTVDPNA